MTVSMQYVKHQKGINWRTKIVLCEKDEAVFMWRDGFDTYDIAHALGIYEAVIWNELWKWRAA